MRNLHALLLVFGCSLAAALWPAAAAASPDWPNDPPGSQLLTDFDFDSLVGPGWNNTGGDVSIITDPTAPVSPTHHVIQMRYAKGFPAGIGPSNEYFALGQRREVYAGFWWKANAGWQQETMSGTSKIAFFISNGQFDVFTGMHGPQGGPYFIYWCLESPTIDNRHTGDRVQYIGSQNFSPNVHSIDIVPGNWYRIETYQKFSTTSESRDGILRWWVNGTLAGNYTDVNYDVTLPWAQFQFSPTWGGLNNTKTQTDYYWFDHARVSAPNGAPEPTADAGTEPPPDAQVGMPVDAGVSDAATPADDQGVGAVDTAGGNAASAAAGGGCSLAPGGAHASPAMLWMVLVVAGALLLRRRRHGAAR